MELVLCGGKLELVLTGSRLELVLGTTELVIEPVFGGRIVERALEGSRMELVLEPVLGGGGTPSHLFSPDLNSISIKLGYGLWDCLCLH